MPDRIFIADVIPELKEWAHAAYSVENLGTNLKKQLAGEAHFEKKLHSDPMFGRVLQFFQALDKEGVTLLEDKFPHLSGFFSCIPGAVRSFDSTCKFFAENEERTTVYCETAQKGDHTLVEMTPLIFSALRAREGNKVQLVNKDETESTGFAYAILMALYTSRETLKTADDVISFVKSQNSLRKEGRCKLQISEESVYWIREALCAFVLEKRDSGMIAEIADLHPASLVAVEMGNRKLSYIFSSHTPIQYSNEGDDHKNVFKRFELIRRHARHSNPKGARFFSEVFFDTESIRNRVKEHLDEKSCNVFELVIRKFPKNQRSSPSSD